MADFSRSFGRNARRKAIRMVQNQSHLQVYSASGSARLKPNWAAEVPTNGQALAHLQELYLSAHQQALAECATKLGAKGCWEYYRNTLSHALKFRYDQPFRLLVVKAASRFAGRSVRTDRNQPV